MSEFAVEALGLSKFYHSKPALNDLTLRIRRGGIHAIVGSNGAGKSTLFRVLLGFVTQDSGDAIVLGVPSGSLTHSLRGKIAYVNDEHTLPGWLTVSQVKQVQRSYYPDWSELVFKNVINNFDVNPGQRIDSLSRGERAGLSLAMALAQNPELLILDEPTLGLDVVSKQEFLDAVLFSTHELTTVVYCSHQMEEVERLADDLIILEQGQVKAQSAPDVFSHRITQWIVDARHRHLVSEKIPEYLGGRVIDDKFQFYVIDTTAGFKSKLALLGISQTSSQCVGLAQAVRAFLGKNHVGRPD